MDSRSFSKQLTSQLARRFPQSDESVYSYRYETMVRSEESEAFSKIAIVIDSELEPDVARYMLGNILQAFRARQEFRGIHCGLHLWCADGVFTAYPSRINLVLGRFDGLIPTQCTTGTADELIEKCTPVCGRAEQIIVLTHKEKWEALQASHIKFCRHSVLVYPSKIDTAPQMIHGTLGLGLDCEERVAFTPQFISSCMPEMECFSVGTQLYRRDDEMQKAASYAGQMFWIASAAQSAPDSVEAQDATLALCKIIHETGWKYIILAGKIGNNVKTDLRFAIMIPSVSQDKAIRGPFSSDAVVLATSDSLFSLSTSCEGLWGLQDGQEVQMVGCHIPDNKTTDAQLFTSRGELL